MRIVDKLSFPWLEGEPRDRCWVIGAGPTLDDCDLRLLRREAVFACNAAVQACYANAVPCWWVAHQWESIERSLHQSCDYLITHPGQVSRLAGEQIFVHCHPGQFEFHKCSTVAQLSMLFAHALGFKQVCLVGVDLGVRGIRDYASCIDCESRAKVYHQAGTMRKKKREWKYHRDNVPINIITTSTMFPAGIFPFYDFETLAKNPGANIPPLTNPEPVDIEREWPDSEVFGTKWKHKEVGPE